MKLFGKIVCFLLALLMTCSFVSCGGQTGDVTTTDGGGGAPQVSGFVPQNAYTIVWGDLYSGSLDHLDSKELLLDAFEACYGLKCNTRSDYYVPSKGLKPAEYEILLGDTNRPQSEAAFAQLGVNDYTYFVESEGVIVICGGSTDATNQAVVKFCEDVLGYRNGTVLSERKSIEVGASYTHRDTYPCSSATLNGVKLSEWKIALYGEIGADAACALVRSLGKYTGERIALVEKKLLTEADKHVIHVGSDRNTSDWSEYYSLKVETGAGENTIVLDSNAKDQFAAAQRQLIKHVNAAQSGGVAALTVAATDELKYANDDEVAPWTLSDGSERVISDGVTYIEQLYYDDDDLPYRVYAMIVDPAKNSICMGTAKDGYDKTVEAADRAIVEEHMRAAVANGKNVIAGVNADFFAMQGDYHPTGLAIKDGVLISPVNGKPFFGFAAAGVAMIGEAREYSEDLALVTAVGGGPVILREGVPTKTAHTNDVHPRTLVGITADGKIVLAVIDGRQLKISNGATLFRCARLMESLGCEIALNLDGGGSSTFVTREGDTYTTHNSPSDGEPRKVYNSLLVVAK